MASALPTGRFSLAGTSIRDGLAIRQLVRLLRIPNEPLLIIMLQEQLLFFQERVVVTRTYELLLILFISISNLALDRVLLGSIIFTAAESVVKLRSLNKVGNG